jgi:hypothetical protein
MLRREMEIGSVYRFSWELIVWGDWFIEARFIGKTSSDFFMCYLQIFLGLFGEAVMFSP